MTPVQDLAGRPQAVTATDGVAEADDVEDADAADPCVRLAVYCCSALTRLDKNTSPGDADVAPLELDPELALDVELDDALEAPCDDSLPPW